jgi:hypothetical protein
MLKNHKIIKNALSQKSQNRVKHNLFNIYITKMFLHNLSQRHVSAFLWVTFRLNIFLCEVTHTILYGLPHKVKCKPYNCMVYLTKESVNHTIVWFTSQWIV